VSTATASHPWRAYYTVFNALILLTVVTVGLSYFDLGEMVNQFADASRGMLEPIKVGKFSLGMLVPELELGHGVNIVVGLIVAVIKASLVIWYFMHQNHEDGINRFVLVFSIALLCLAFFAFCTDFVFLGTYAGAMASAAMGAS